SSPAFSSKRARAQCAGSLLALGCRHGPASLPRSGIGGGLALTVLVAAVEHVLAPGLEVSGRLVRPFEHSALIVAQVKIGVEAKSAELAQPLAITAGVHADAPEH